MPKFIFNKLVRDKMPLIYNEYKQKIHLRKLNQKELIVALKEKLIEEAQEIPVADGTHEEIVEELADVEQLIDDIRSHLAITDDEITVAKIEKFTKKGGFINGIFVESIELSDEDKWVEYYRNEPLKYPEINEIENDDSDLPQVENGTYRHNKSSRLYEVIGVALSTETNVPLVVYRPIYEYKNYDLFARPYDMFTDMVELDGEKKPRFEKIDA